MQTLHDATNITLKKYYSEPNFIDYTTQPKTYKTYPHFYRRFDLSDYPQLQFISNFGKATYTKKYGKDEVILRSNPSAGGLYPCEIYIQIRKVKGFLSGIYHYEPLNNHLTLIHELSNDGLEYYFKTSQNAAQFIFLISCVPFRTTWKYQERSIRYLLLDTGHQIAAVHTALTQEGIKAQLTFDFDAQELNSVLGFEGYEHIYAALRVDLDKEMNIKPLRQALPFVAGCDYQYKEGFIEEFYQTCMKSQSLSQSVELPNFFENQSKSELQIMIDQRRSARGYKKEGITQEAFASIYEGIFEFAQTKGIEIFHISNNIEGQKSGLYKNVSVLKAGSFEQKAQELALNQALASQSSVTFFFTANPNQNYLQSTIICAFLAHVMYLKSTHLEIGCSAIGAYFDSECQTFLETSNNILYLLTIGK